MADTGEPRANLVLSRDLFFHPDVDRRIEQERATAQRAAVSEPPPVPLWRRLLFSQMVCMPVATGLGALLGWLLFEPFVNDQNLDDNLAALAMIVVTVATTVGAALVAEGLTRRLWRLATVGALQRVGLAAACALGVSVVGGLVMMIGVMALVAPFLQSPPTSVVSFPTPALLSFMALRSLLFAGFGAAAGFALNVGRGTRAQTINSVLGGALGGAVGGILFDSTDRFIFRGVEDAWQQRMAAFTLLGLCLGLFVALGDRLARQAWLKVKTGPLAGKSFVLHRVATMIGSRPQDDVYLFKDALISPSHVRIQQIGSGYEMVNLSTASPAQVNGRRITARRLSSGDQITLGATVLEFEERARRPFPQKAKAKRGTP